MRFDFSASQMRIQVDICGSVRSRISLDVNFPFSLRISIQRRRFQVQFLFVRRPFRDGIVPRTAHLRFATTNHMLCQDR